jgi:hypothetical protein
MGTLGAALVTCGTSCRTAPVTVPIVLSSAIELGPRRSIAVAGLRGWKDRSSSELLEQALAATGRFAIVERARVDGAIRSLQLSTLEPEGAAKLGALLGADAVVYGFIEQEYEEAETHETFQGKSGSTANVNGLPGPGRNYFANYLRSTLRGEAVARASFAIVDGTSGALLAVKTCEERRADVHQKLITLEPGDKARDASDARPEALDRDELAEAARRAVVDRFIEALGPTEVRATFLVDLAFPQLQAGIDWASRGALREAQASFQSAISKGLEEPRAERKQLAKAYWDLALAEEYAGPSVPSGINGSGSNHEQAIRMLRIACDLGKEKRCREELERLERRRQDSRRLAEWSSKKTREASDRAAADKLTRDEEERKAALWSDPVLVANARSARLCKLDRWREDTLSLLKACSSGDAAARCGNNEVDFAQRSVLEQRLRSIEGRKQAERALLVESNRTALPCTSSFIHRLSECLFVSYDTPEQTVLYGRSAICRDADLQPAMRLFE